MPANIAAILGAYGRRTGCDNLPHAHFARADATKPNCMKNTTYKHNGSQQHKHILPQEGIKPNRRPNIGRFDIKTKRHSNVWGIFIIFATAS